MDKSEFSDPVAIKIIDAYLDWQTFIAGYDEHVEELESLLDYFPIFERTLDGIKHVMIGVDSDTGEQVTLYATSSLENDLWTIVVTGDTVAEVIVNSGQLVYKPRFRVDVRYKDPSWTDPKGTAITVHASNDEAALQAALKVLDVDPSSVASYTVESLG